MDSAIKEKKLLAYHYQISIRYLQDRFFYFLPIVALLIYVIWLLVVKSNTEKR